MDYHCAKFDDFNFSRFGFIVRTDRQTESHRERERQTRMIALLRQLPTQTASVGVGRIFESVCLFVRSKIQKLASERTVEGHVSS